MASSQSYMGGVFVFEDYGPGKYVVEVVSLRLSLLGR